MAEKQKPVRIAERIHDSENVFLVTAEDSSPSLRGFQQTILSRNKLIRIVTSSAQINPDVLETLTEKTA